MGEGGLPAVRWEAWEVGNRVMVRVRLAPGGTHKYTDIIGVIVAMDDDGLLLERRSGERTRVPGNAIVTGKLVPPPPPRRARRTDS